MKVGIVGVGNIAKKAYVPVYVQMQDRYEFVVCSRDRERAEAVAAQYGFSGAVGGIDALIDSGIKAAFIHVPTAAHFETAQRLMEAGIPILMDKPISMSPRETHDLFDIAQSANVLFMTGLNRRFAPMTDKLKAFVNKNMLYISKNRVSSARDPRRVVYDEFIHPLDTAIYLLDDEILDFDSSLKMNASGQLVRAVVRMETKTATALVYMNLQSGANTEIFEVQTPEGTGRVENLVQFTNLTRDGKTVEDFGDWETTLEKRGFAPMVRAFLDRVEGGLSDLRQRDVPLSHELCERMLKGLRTES